jgi:WD40 repeat protein
VWDVATGAEAAGWADLPADVAALAFHPSRPILVSGGTDPGFRVWDLAAKKLAAVRRTPTAVRAVAFTADGGELLTGMVGTPLAAWDADGWQEQARFVGTRGPSPGCSWPPAGPHRLLGRADRTVKAWSLARAAVTGIRMAGHESWSRA